MWSRASQMVNVHATAVISKKNSKFDTIRLFIIKKQELIMMGLLSDRILFAF